MICQKKSELQHFFTNLNEYIGETLHKIIQSTITKKNVPKEKYFKINLWLKNCINIFPLTFIVDKTENKF